MHVSYVIIALGAIATGLFFLLPAGSVAQASVEVLTHAAVLPAIVVGLRRHKPAAAAGWKVILAAQVVYLAANLAGGLLPALRGTPVGYPSVADALWLTAYLGFAVGVALLLAERSRGLGLGALLDTATAGLSLSAIVWVAFVEPTLADPMMSGSAAAASAAYMALDMALVALLIHLAISPGARQPALWLLAGAVLGQIIGDALYGSMPAGTTMAYGHPAYLGWLAFYVLLAASALHPSMRNLAEPGSRRRTQSQSSRMIILAGTALVPPAVLLVARPGTNTRVLAGLTIVAFTLVLLRLLRMQIDLAERTRVQQLKDQFISVVSHELRTPLTVIHGAVTSLERGVGGTLEPMASRLVNMAATNSERLIRLVNDLLDVQRLASGQVRISPTQVSVRGLFAATRETLQGQADDVGVALDFRDTDCQVAADAGRLLQVLVNLVGNAVKFSPPGGFVTVTADERDGEVVFRVIDQGRGIPRALQERIFDPFEQVDASDSRDRNGSGLGLAICRALVEQHGGRIWVTSAPGVGSTFLFTLPAARPSPEGAAGGLDEPLHEESAVVAGYGRHLPSPPG